jgi:hypothetical protein
VLATFTVLYDANVLYPSTLRSLLMYLALSGLYRARWTDRIHEEWIRSLLRARPDIKPEALARTRVLMDKHADDALITNYEELIAGLRLPDPDDRHVLAAAIRGHVDVIVTYNEKDFPSEVLKPYALATQHPDVFIAHLFDLDPYSVINAVHNQLKDLKNPPVTMESYLKRLELLKLPVTAAHLRGFPL